MNVVGTKGFSSTCYPCAYYLMQGCVRREDGHPWAGRNCRSFKERVVTEDATRKRASG